MRINNKRRSRVASLTLILGIAGCAAPREPFDVKPAIAPTAPRATQNAPRTPTRPSPPETPGLVQASASVASAPTPQTLTVDEAVRFTLENNPMLQAVRHQRGFAQGGVVIARTYPYNPLLQVSVAGVGGAADSGITNRVFNVTTMRLDVELRGQGTHRRAAAGAVVTRTEWEIAVQEVTVAVAAVRAFNTVVYRRRKLEVLEDTVRFTEDVANLVKKLVDLGRMRPADLIIIRTELDAAHAQLGQ